MGDPVQAPAAAYWKMEELLGEGWFLIRPPEHGVRLEVTGEDNIPTQWDMTAEQAEHCIKNLRRDRLIRSAIPHKY